MPYIYEMDLALLKMQYLLPFNFHIWKIFTVLTNHEPFNRTNMSVHYCCHVYETYKRFPDGQIIINAINEPITGELIKTLQAESLPDLVNQCRIWSILYNNEHNIVHNSSSSTDYFDD